MAKKKATKKVAKKTTKKTGRPTKYTQQQKDTLLRLAPLGYTNKEMANLIGCAESTFYKLMEDDPIFSESLKISKDLADSLVIDSLFKKATGKISTKEVVSGICPNTGNIIESTRVKEIAPDTTSMIFWLKNRRPDQWREKQVIEHQDATIKIDVDDSGL